MNTSWLTQQIKPPARLLRPNIISTWKGDKQRHPLNFSCLRMLRQCLEIAFSRLICFSWGLLKKKRVVSGEKMPKINTIKCKLWKWTGYQMKLIVFYMRKWRVLQMPNQHCSVFALITKSSANSNREDITWWYWWQLIYWCPRAILKNELNMNESRTLGKRKNLSRDKCQTKASQQHF